MGRHVNDKALVLPPHIMTRHLELTGDGTGEDNLIQDYSAAAGVARISPAAGEIFQIERMIVFIQDTGNFSASGYGNLGALTNGLVLEYDCGGAVHPLVEEPIQSNAEWAAQCYDARYDNYGTGDNMLFARWTFAKAGAPIILSGDRNEEVRLHLNDNFTGLVKHQFLLQGLYIRKNP